MAQQIQLRHDTAANWTAANPILAIGEIGVETDTTKLKIGNGVGTWGTLTYAGGGGGDALVANPLSQFSATTSAQLAGVISDETGTGQLVFATNPTLAGVPNAPTAIPGTNTVQIATTAHVFAERANVSTLTNKTISGAANTLTAIPAAGITGVIPIANLATGVPNGTKFIRDDGTLQVAGIGNALTTNPLSQFALTTSAQLSGIMTDGTGTGQLVFATSPTLAGVPLAPTAVAGTNTTQVATTQHVFAERTNVSTLTGKTIAGASNTLSVRIADLSDTSAYIKTLLPAVDAPTARTILGVSALTNGIDGGNPTSVYGGTTAISGGTP